MNDTTETYPTTGLTCESILQKAMWEIDDAIKWARTRDNGMAKYVMQEAVPLRKQIDADLSDCYYLDRPQPDAGRALKMLVKAAHLSERASRNFMTT